MVLHPHQIPITGLRNDRTHTPTSVRRLISAPFRGDYKLQNGKVGRLSTVRRLRHIIDADAQVLSAPDVCGCEKRGWPLKYGCPQDLTSAHEMAKNDVNHSRHQSDDADDDDRSTTLQGASLQGASHGRRPY